MTYTSTFEEVATAIKSVFDEEFEPEGFVMIFDNLHESLGRFRVDVGIAPTEDVPSSRDALVQETNVEVRFFDLWKDEIDPKTIVNPTRITGFAERFRRALAASDGMTLGTDSTWFFNVDRTQYPNDPTGNKSRFIMAIRAFGNNMAQPILRETGA